MEKIKKLMAIVLCMVLTVTLLPTAAKAAGVAVSNSTELYNALESIAVGESITIELKANIDYPYSIYLDGKSVTFNLNTFHLNITGDSGPALSVYNGGSVSLSGEGELNVTAGSGVYGVVAYYGSSAEVTNATATSMSGYGAYAFGAASAVIVRQAAQAVGDYSAGVYAEQGGSITVGSASGSGYLSRGAYVFNGGTITVIGNAEANGGGSAGAYAYTNNGLLSVVTIGGNATAGGIDSYGAYAEGAGSSVAVGTAGATGEGSIGANALNGGAVTAGSATASGTRSFGACASIEGSVEVAASASASGNTGCVGAYAKYGGSVTAGSAAAVSNNSVGAWADGVDNGPSSVNVAGSATATGHTNCTGALASGGAKVTVGSAKADGVTSADGLGIFGAEASGADSLVEVHQTAEAKGEGSVGAFAIDSGKVTVALHAAATGDYSCGASAGLNGSVEVGGNATSTGDGGCGVSVSDNGSVTVNGSARTNGAYSCGAKIMNGGVAVIGDVTASGQSCIGADVYGGGTITIDGIITADLYIYVENEEKYPDDGVPDGAPYADYYLYSSGASAVRAKFYVSLRIKTNTLLPATTGAAYSDTIATSYTGTQPRTFNATGLPSGLTINASTGVISGIPDAGTDMASPYSVTVSVTDGTVTGQRIVSMEVYPGAAVPLINTQPASMNRNSGQTATFTIGATVTDGGTLYYQWQRSTNGGTSWGNINGAVNTSYTTGSLTAAYNGYQYRCVVTNDLSGTSAEKVSNAAILTVNPAAVAPTIQTQPVNATKNIGSTATFTVAATASDGGTLTYQWQRSTNGGMSWNSATGTGVTSASYTTNALTASNNNNRFRCVVTNSKNGTTAYANSAAAILTMNPAAVVPALNTQPANATKNIGQTATFTVAATTSDGGTLTYEWQRSTNGGISWSSATGTGVTSASYTTDTLTATNNGNRYRCVVTNSKNGTTAYANSAAAILTMNPAAVAPVINTQPQNATKLVGETATFATGATASDGGSLAYQWQKYGDSSWSDMSGETSESYTTGVLAFADNGAQYRCVVTNSKNGTSAVMNSEAALLTVSPANQPPMAKNPLPAQNVEAGKTISFTAADIAQDSDGDVLTIAGIMSEPAAATATASVNDGTVTILGKAAGSTSVTVTVSDGTDTAQVTVPIAVSAAPAGSESSPDKYVKNQYIVDSTDAVAVDLTQGSDILSAAQLQVLTLLNASKPIVLTGDGYTITFKPGTIRQTAADCDLGLSFNTGADYSSIQSIAGDGVLLMLDFQHSGPLPGEAEIRVQVGTQYRGKMLYYYFFNPAAGMLEYRQTATVGSDGSVTLTQSSCSTYILSVRAPLGTEYPDDIPLTGDRTDAVLAITMGALLALLCLGFLVCRRWSETQD